MDKLTCDILHAQSADAWRSATARARAWSRDEAEATATLAGPAFVGAVVRLVAAARSRAVVNDVHEATLRVLADRCAAVSMRRRAFAERYRDMVHLAYPDGSVLDDDAGRRRARICDGLFHRAAAAARVSERTGALCGEIERALDHEAALGRLAGLRERLT